MRDTTSHHSNNSPVKAVKLNYLLAKVICTFEMFVLSENVGSTGYCIQIRFQGAHWRRNLENILQGNELIKQTFTSATSIHPHMLNNDKNK